MKPFSWLSSEGTETTPVSLVIPLRDETPSLPRLFRSLELQTRPPDEVVLVDAGSIDGTLENARALAAGDPRVHLIDAGPATPGRARNVGIAAASHENVALTDAGVELDAGWLEELCRAADADDSIDIVYGHFDPAPGSFFERCAALAYVPAMDRESGCRTPSVVSCLLRRTVWNAVGGFPDLRAAEDRIFMERAETAGARAKYAPTAKVLWQLQPTIGRTFARFRLYSRHNVLARQQGKWHHGVARQYAVAAPFLLLALRSRRWLMVPVAGLAARIGKSIWTRRERRGVLWACNPARFFVVGAILLAIDAATYVGWAEAIRLQRRHRRARRCVE